MLHSTLTIANWNLQRILPTQNRKLRIKEETFSKNADIWFFTETHTSAVPKKNFYSVFSAEPDRKSQDGEKWAAIWSRWPLEPLEDHVSDKARCAAARISNSPHGELVLFCGVLPWRNSWQGIPGVGGQAYKAALSGQTSDWIRLRAEFPNATLIVAGDFNQDLATRHYYGSKLTRNLLYGALKESGLVPLTAENNDPISRDSPPYACIDHICISANMHWKLNLTSRWPSTPAPQVGLSDHFGVMAIVSRAVEG